MNVHLQEICNYIALASCFCLVYGEVTAVINAFDQLGLTKYSGKLARQYFVFRYKFCSPFAHELHARKFHKKPAYSTLNAVLVFGAAMLACQVAELPKNMATVNLCTAAATVYFVLVDGIAFVRARQAVAVVLSMRKPMIHALPKKAL